MPDDIDPKEIVIEFLMANNQAFIEFCKERTEDYDSEEIIDAAFEC